jgi:hypothetical protein
MDEMSNPESVENYLEFLKNSIAQGSNNVFTMNSRSATDFNNVIHNLDFSNYVDSADYHYFISRILFLSHLPHFSYFCAYQCIENYLKGFIKFHSATPPQSHDLNYLLSICKNLDKDPNSFINGDHIETILIIYQAFYETPRYPAGKKFPGKGSFIFPFDIFILDYFVFKMKELLPIPQKQRSILEHNHYLLDLCMRKSPMIYNLFLINNMNYQ